jgi:hypothetical protein
MKEKLFVAIYTVSIVAVLVGLNFIVTKVKNTTNAPSSPEETVDTSIGQFTERPNSNAGGDSSTPSLLAELFYPDRETPAAGCSLYFSDTPKSKAVEPYGNANYSLTISNRGKDTCQNVSLSMYYSDKENFVSAAPSPTASDYYWAIGDLGSGKSRSISLITKINAPDGSQVQAEGCATADNAQDVCAENAMFAQSGASKSSLLANAFSIPQAFSAAIGGLFDKKEFGIWVWDSPAVMTSAYAQQVISVSKKNGFNVIYLTIDDYVGLADMKDGPEKQAAIANYMKALSVFVKGAQAAGLQVDAVGGGRDWAEPANRWKGYALIDFVKQYNASYPTAKLRGLQYDVETYLLQDYNANKETRLREYVEFVDESARRMQSVDAQFSIVIPHFYDSVQAWTPSFNYNGKDAYTYTHLLDVLKQKKGTAVIIMAYRNFFDGTNGTKQISEAEIKEAAQGGYPTKVIVAQETGDVPPAYVTFHAYPKSSLFDDLGQIRSYFAKYKSFGGTAVHYFDAFTKLE